MVKKTVKAVLVILLTFFVACGLFIGYLTLANQVHQPIEELEVVQNSKNMLSHEASFKVTTFNIGYGGLDKSQNFFADGGVNSRSESLEKTMENMDASMEFMSEIQSDIYLIQEIDVKASRSYNLNELDLLKRRFDDYSSVFAYNYNAIWVPVPLMSPMGHVDAGMGIFSKYLMDDAKRHQLEGQESWPMKLVELDRCFIETNLPLDNGKNLLVVNLHLSAYDEGGLLRNQQVEHLKRYINEQYEAGNYVLLGGDWNQLISDVQLSDPDFMANWPTWLVQISTELTETGFKWGVDDSVMTVRDLVTDYIADETFVTIIDGFLVSPNLEIVNVKGHDLGFEFSDHNPVTIELKFN